jgi:hypothetical protein
MSSIMANAAPSEWLRADPLAAGRERVDESQQVIYGVRVAELGAFKSRRGQFDDEALLEIARIGSEQEKGLKSRLAHPTLSDDGIGKFLGRLKVFRRVEDLVRADLYLDPSSFDTPNGDLGSYVMDLADSDPDAFGMSLVLQSTKLDPKTRKPIDELDEDEWHDFQKAKQPPIWMPTSLHACDVVDSGDATSAFLATSIDTEALPDTLVRQGSALLDQAFAGKSRAEVAARCQGWLTKYLDGRYGPEEHDMSSDDKQVDQATQPTDDSDKRPVDESKAKAALGDTTPANQAVPPPAADTLATAATQRCVAIAELCTLASCPERTAELSGDTTKTVEDVRELLAADKQKQLDLGDKHIPPNNESDDPEAELKAEYKANRSVYESHGVTEEMYLFTAKTNANGGVLAQ